MLEIYFSGNVHKRAILMPLHSAKLKLIFQFNVVGFPLCYSRRGHLPALTCSVDEMESNPCSNELGEAWEEKPCPEAEEQRLEPVSPTSQYCSNTARLPQTASFAKMETLQNFWCKIVICCWNPAQKQRGAPGSELLCI